MQRLGQHFLKNQSALRAIAAALEMHPGDAVIEIGPGHGELTEMIGDRLEVVGEGKFFAIERDKKLVEGLKKKFPNVQVITGDALKILPSLISNLPSATTYRLIGNIPYYITGHLLRVISELPHLPAQCVFTIQKEVAERICAQPPHMNRLAASVQFWAKPKIIRTVPREDFRPMPKVDSAVLLLETRTNADLTRTDAEKYYRAVRALFAQPRKTVLNNIVEGMGQGKDDAAKLLEQAGIDPKSRPQNLGIEQIAALSKII